VRILRFMLLALGVIAILISLPLLGFAALGYLGVLADVGPTENRLMGVQLLSLGLPPLIFGVCSCAFGLVAYTWNHRRADAAPKTTLADGPS
jgi:hypothetical protein